MNAKAIEVTDLTIAYKDKPVLWDVDMDVPTGTLMAKDGSSEAKPITRLRWIKVQYSEGLSTRQAKVCHDAE